MARAPTFGARREESLSEVYQNITFREGEAIVTHCRGYLNVRSCDVTGTGYWLCQVRNILHSTGITGIPSQWIHYVPNSIRIETSSGRFTWCAIRAGVWERHGASAICQVRWLPITVPLCVVRRAYFPLYNITRESTFTTISRCHTVLRGACLVYRGKY